MSKVATHFGDPQAVTKRRCDTLLAGADLDAHPFLAGLEIVTRLPASAPRQPLLVVRSGIWLEYTPPVLGVNRVRIVAFSVDDDLAWDVCSWFHGQLLALAGDSELRSFRYDDGPRRGTDPQYDTPISAATLRASMRPAII